MDKMEFCRHVYNRLDTFKNLLYFRSYAILGINAVLITAIFSVWEKFEFAYKGSSHWFWVANNMFLPFIIFTFIFASTWYCILSFHPRFWIVKYLPSSMHKKFKAKPKLLSVFSYIVEWEREEYLELLENASSKDLLKDLSDGIYNLSHILDYRYKKLKKAYNFFSLTILLTIFFSAMIMIQYFLIPK